MCDLLRDVKEGNHIRSKGVLYEVLSVFEDAIHQPERTQPIRPYLTSTFVICVQKHASQHINSAGSMTRINVYVLDENACALKKKIVLSAPLKNTALAAFKKREKGVKGVYVP